MKKALFSLFTLLSALFFPATAFAQTTAPSTGDEAVKLLPLFIILMVAAAAAIIVCVILLKKKK